jgi:hypothetical protein
MQATSVVVCNAPCQLLLALLCFLKTLLCMHCASVPNKERLAKIAPFLGISGRCLHAFHSKFRANTDLYDSELQAPSLSLHYC